MDSNKGTGGERGNVLHDVGDHHIYKDGDKFGTPSRSSTFEAASMGVAVAHLERGGKRRQRLLVADHRPREPLEKLWLHHI